MERRQFNLLKAWLANPRRKPLILRGARQVGKSTLVTLFASQQKRRLAVVNLERHPELLGAFQAGRPKDLVDVFEALPGVGAITPDSLLFLDEIQAVPDAIPALRYFYEELGEIPLVAAGSFMEVALANHRFSMPVGRIEYLHMGPMTFTEFLDALEETKLSSLVQTFEMGREIHPAVHARLLELVRLYCFIGGMPEAVDTYARTRHVRDVGQVHNSIIETWREDFPKYIGSRNLARMQQVFNFAARNLGKKVKYSLFSSHDKSATIKGDIELLCMARVLSKVVHSHCSGLPLQAEVSPNVYKLVFLDVGLMNAMCGLDWMALRHSQNTPFVNAGPVAEQFVGQHVLDMLSASPNREMTYWLREGRANNAEVDYVVALNGRIVPIEVKAAASGRLKSLHQFVAEKRVRHAVRFDTGLPHRQSIAMKARRGDEMVPVNYKLTSLPLYLVESLPRIDFAD